MEVIEVKVWNYIFISSTSLFISNSSLIEFLLLLVIDFIAKIFSGVFWLHLVYIVTRTRIKIIIILGPLIFQAIKLVSAKF